jgi:hypothetical protein
MKVLLALAFVAISVSATAYTPLGVYTSIAKFGTYNHPDMRSCMVDIYLQYTSGSVVPATPLTNFDNGTAGMSLYFELYHGSTPSKPAGGDEDLDCTVWSEELRWNHLACMAYDDSAGSIRDSWDSLVTNLNPVTTLTTGIITGAD